MLLHAKAFGDVQCVPLICLGDISGGDSFTLCVGHPAPDVVAASVGALCSLEALAGRIVAAAVFDFDCQRGPVLRMYTYFTGFMIDSLGASKLHTKLWGRGMDWC